MRFENNLFSKVVQIREATPGTRMQTPGNFTPGG